MTIYKLAGYPASLGGGGGGREGVGRWRREVGEGREGGRVNVHM